MNIESPGATYRLISFLLLPLWFIHGIWHGQSQGLRMYLKLRFCGPKNRSQQSVVWVHAASVGEVIAVTPLVEKLRTLGENIFFTSFTATGLQTIQRNFPVDIESGILPVDFFLTCRHFIRQGSIKLCLLVETELWPELLFQTAHAGIAIIQVNARLSEKSTKAPIFIRYLLRRTLSAIRLHLARSEHDRQQLMDLGADTEKIRVLGNLKARVNTEAPYPRLIQRDYLLLASSHDQEEALFLDQRPPRWSQPLIVIAPRHPKRSRHIQQYLSKSGLEYAVRSQSQEITAQTQIYLADTLGELKSFMAHASLVIMGGSFDQSGGHNLMEPASLGCAIISGPSDSNIVHDIQQLGNAVITVTDMAMCWEKIIELLAEPEQRKTLGSAAKQAVQQKPDPLARYLAEIKHFL